MSHIHDHTRGCFIFYVFLFVFIPERDDGVCSLSRGQLQWKGLAALCQSHELLCALQSTDPHSRNLNDE